METVNRDFHDFRSWFRREYQGLLGERWPTFQIALNWLLQNGGSNIVETGTIRFPEWADGKSTWLFGDYCKRHGGHLWTVDSDPSHIEESKRQTLPFSENITYVQDDSIKFLRSFDLPIHFLYLDSFDYQRNDPEPSQRHNLLELQSTLKNLHPRACVLIDDNCEDGGGKGELSKVILIEYGFVCLLDYYQSVWVRP